jgi:hypothetical protein
MRSCIFALTLIVAIGLLATVELSNLSSYVAAQEIKKDKKGQKQKSKSPFAKKGEFNYRLCRELGETPWRCGVRLHYWGNRNPNGKVIY